MKTLHVVLDLNVIVLVIFDVLVVLDLDQFLISFCIWSTELDSGLPSTNTYSCTRPNRAPGIELEEVDIELHNHRARHQSHGTSKRITTSSSITYRAG